MNRQNKILISSVNKSLKKIFFLYLLLHICIANGQTYNIILSDKSLLIGLQKFKENDLLSAIKNCTEAIKYDSLNWKAYLYKANSENLLKKHDHAIIDYNKVIEMNSFIPDPYRGRGNVFLEIGKYALAIEDYNKAILLDSTKMGPYYGKKLGSMRL